MKRMMSKEMDPGIEDPKKKMKRGMKKKMSRRGKKSSRY